MKRRTNLAVLVFTILLLLGNSSKAISQSSKKAVKIPQDIILPMIVYQPDCPLKLTSTDVWLYLSGGEEIYLVYRNDGTKPVKSCKVGYISTKGISGTIAFENTDGSTMPGKELSIGRPPYEQLVPLTDELRKQLGIQGPMRSVIMVAVLRVEFADGSVYDNEQLYKEIKDHFKQLCN
jgi:hypothetical protein